LGRRVYTPYCIPSVICQIFETESMIKFSTSLLPRSVEKRAIGLRFENEIE